MNKTIALLIPVYNDWDSVSMLLPSVNEALQSVDELVKLILIDDGSTERPLGQLANLDLPAFESLHILRLRRNLGHQRALAVGMAYVWEHVPCDAVAIMDGDGEDAPKDLPRLIEQHRNNATDRVVFAERRRRSETVLFRIFYHLYRFVHYLLTGRGVRVGNFSLVPRSLLNRLVVVPEMWNHYAASVYKAKLPNVNIHVERQKRLSGKSSMNFVDLVTHGLSALSVYSELVGVRLLIFFGGCSTVALGSGAVIILMRISGSALIPEWTVFASGILALISLQTGLFALLASFIALGSRTSYVFLPQRDYVFFVDAFEPLSQVAE